MLLIDSPSIAGGLRTVSVLPEYGARPHRWLAPFHEDRPCYRPKDHARVMQLYHPMVAALAPPFCALRGPRLIVAAAMQAGLDVSVGAVALGCSILCLLMNQRRLAGAYLSEHSINLMQLTALSLLTASVGGSIITCMFWLN